MDILIGKHGNQPFPLTESSISREHAVLHVDSATGKMTLCDKNSTNGTWILAKDGRFKRLVGEAPVGAETQVRLGAKVTFRIKELLAKPEQPPVNISGLSAIYETYMQNKMDLDSKTSNIMMWKMGSLTLASLVGATLFSLVPKDFVGDETEGNIIKGIITVILLLAAWIIVSIIQKNLIARKDKNEKFFKTRYCCPKCGYHFGQKVYHNIIAEGKCPNNNCKCKFTA